VDRLIQTCERPPWQTAPYRKLFIPAVQKILATQRATFKRKGFAGYFLFVTSRR
jgi:hypothetical protein